MKSVCSFATKFASLISWVLSCFDRVIFKGHLPISRPDQFERLAGSAAERRGLDLAIASRISELFGGSARLVAEPERRTAVVLDWPSRLAGQ